MKYSDLPTIQVPKRKWNLCYDALGIAHGGLDDLEPETFELIMSPIMDAHRPIVKPDYWFSLTPKSTE